MEREAAFRSSCEVIASADKITKGALNAINETREKLTKARSIKAIAKYGAINYLGDILGPINDLVDKLTNIDQVAKQIILSTIGEGVSNCISLALESVLRPLLDLLTLSPDIIYSLVKIPHTKAVEHAYLEHDYLMRARHDLTIILSILKYDDFKRDEYYFKMKNAIPFLNDAIDAAYILWSKLSGYEPYFDEIAYNKLSHALDDAYKLTLINRDILKKLEEMEVLKYNELTREIKVKSINEENALYRKFISGQTSDNYLQKSIEYFTAKEALKLKTDYQLKEARSIAKFTAITDLLNSLDTTYTGGLTTNELLKTPMGKKIIKFVVNMTILYDAIKDYKDSVTKAYVEYQTYHVLCNTLYTMKDLIIKIFDWFIKTLKNKPAGTTTRVIKAILSVIQDIETTKAIFTDAKKNDRNNYGHLLNGNNLLKEAKLILDANITPSTIGLINLSKKLFNSNTTYENFIKRLAGIPDFDGKKNIWAVNLVESAILNPYPELINFDFKNSLKVIDKLLAHNDIVKGVLLSYNPPVSKQTNELIRVLNQLGYIDLFAASISVAEIIQNVVEKAYPFIVVGDIPSKATCQAIYPELFDSDKTGNGSNKYQVPSYLTSEKYLYNLESKTNQVQDTNEDIKNIGQTIENIVGIDSNKNLINPPQIIDY